MDLLVHDGWVGVLLGGAGLCLTHAGCVGVVAGGPFLAQGGEGAELLLFLMKALMGLSACIWSHTYIVGGTGPLRLPFGLLPVHLRLLLPDVLFSHLYNLQYYNQIHPLPPTQAIYYPFLMPIS